MQVFLAALWVAVGAALGGLCRYGVGVLAVSLKLPWLGVLAVNVAGCFLAGAALALLARQPHLAPWFQPLFVIGFLGSLTTFSAFAVDSLNFALRGDFVAVVLNIGANVFACALAVAVGFVMMRSA